jgi:hypothetical protein
MAEIGRFDRMNRLPRPLIRHFGRGPVHQAPDSG